jgi:NDP-sugar pyrophosphorylase family protein
MKPTLLVLAAGMGSRYGGLKQIDPIGPSGETIIDYSVYDALRAGFDKVVFVIRQDIETAFKEAVAARFADKIAIEYAFQEISDIPQGLMAHPDRTKPWGTGQAVLISASAIDAPFAVINADDFYGYKSFETLGTYLSGLQNEDASCCIVGYEIENTLSEFGSVSRGICDVDADDHLLGVVERTHIERTPSGIIFKDGETIVPLTGTETVSMNMMGFTPAVFARYEAYFREFIKTKGMELKSEFYMPFVVNRLVEEGNYSVKVLRSGEKWFGVTYKEDRPLVVESIRQLIREGVYPASLWT